jgi:hypothetical protein
VNVGDPIWPEPAEIQLPRLLDGDPIALRGYALELSIAEKVVTAIQRGVASTRWRDFGDLYLVSRRHSFEAGSCGVRSRPCPVTAERPTSSWLTPCLATRLSASPDGRLGVHV